MRSISFLFLALALVRSAQAQTTTAESSTATLQSVATFPNQQVTGVAVSRRGRIFVNFPDWSDDHTISVAEIVNGKPQPFPNQEWNKAGGAPNDHFVCVQSVYVDESDSLWILDPAAPKMKQIVKGGPKLVKVDLVKNEVVQIPFGPDIAPEKSYLNDVRVDLKTGTAYITDSGLGAIVVVDCTTGKRADCSRMTPRRRRKRISNSRLTVAGSLAKTESRRRSIPTASRSIGYTVISTSTPSPGTPSSGSRPRTCAIRA